MSDIRNEILDWLAKRIPNLDVSAVRVREVEGPGFTSRRFVVCHDGRNGPERWFVKQYDLPAEPSLAVSQWARNDYEGLARISQILSATESFFAPTPCAFFPSSNSIVMTYHEGINLAKLMSLAVNRYPLGRSAPTKHVSDAGGLLHRIHDQTWSGTPPQYDYLGFFESELHKLRDLWPNHDAELFRNLETKVKDGFTSTMKECRSSCFQHSDFLPANVIVCQDKVGVVDFMKSCPGLPSFDLAIFVSSIRSMECFRPWVKPLLRDLENVFLSGYGLEDVNEDTFALCTALLAPYFLRNQIENNSSRYKPKSIKSRILLRRMTNFHTTYLQREVSALMAL